jgi:plastocyanin
MNGRTRSRALLASVLATALVLAVSGCSGTTGSGGGGNTVVESNKQFSPASLTLQVGDVVTFSNQDTVPHHVFVDTADLGEQAPGASVSWTATANGTFAFRCSIHPSMTGQIVVGTGTGSSNPAAPAGGGSSAPAPSGSGY